MTADGDGVGLRGGIDPQESFLDLFQAEQLRRSLETIGPGESLRQKCVALKEIVEDNVENGLKFPFRFGDVMPHEPGRSEKDRVYNGPSQVPDFYKKNKFC